MPAPSLVYTDPEFSGVMLLDVKGGPHFFDKNIYSSKICSIFLYLWKNVYCFLVLFCFFLQ